VAAPFDVESVLAAIRDAQANVPGYTYRGFCDRIAAAGTRVVAQDQSSFHRCSRS
jgi:hypothetical protein